MADSTELVEILQDIRNWIRAAAYPGVKRLLEEALPDPKSRYAYQLCDGTIGRDAICKRCKISPNNLQAIQSRCIAMGLMATSDGRKTRLFNLADFGLLEQKQEQDGE